jgi:hypothetical protein
MMRKEDKDDKTGWQIHKSKSKPNKEYGGPHPDIKRPKRTEEKKVCARSCTVLQSPSYYRLPFAVALCALPLVGEAVMRLEGLGVTLEPCTMDDRDVARCRFADGGTEASSSSSSLGTFRA